MFSNSQESRLPIFQWQAEKAQITEVIEELGSYFARGCV